MSNQPSYYHPEVVVYALTERADALAACDSRAAPMAAKIIRAVLKTAGGDPLTALAEQASLAAAPTNVPLMLIPGSTTETAVVTPAMVRALEDAVADTRRKARRAAVKRDRRALAAGWGY